MYAALLSLSLLLTGCLPTRAPEVTLIPTFTPPAPPATWTPTPLPTATPMPTPTPAPPTPDPAAISGAAQRGLARVRAAAGEAQLLCLRYEDTTGDGQPAWIALTYQEAEPHARLQALILHDDDTVYRLPTVIPDPATPDYGLGQYATCELQIRDVNADGRPDIAIFGYADGNRSLMHLYTWADGDYRVLGNFRGTAGVWFEDGQGDLTEQVIEGHRVGGGADLVWQVIFTWDGRTYGWTLDRYAWYSLERPQFPLTGRADHAVISFYLLLNDRDMPRAYTLLSPSYQAARPFTEWVAGFATTLRVEASSVNIIAAASGENNARVSAMITSWDNEDGRVIGRIWNVVWDLVRTADGWRLTGGTQQLLDSWEAQYWR